MLQAAGGLQRPVWHHRRLHAALQHRPWCVHLVLQWATTSPHIHCRKGLGYFLFLLTSSFQSDKHVSHDHNSVHQPITAVESWEPPYVWSDFCPITNKMYLTLRATVDQTSLKDSLFSLSAGEFFCIIPSYIAEHLKKRLAAREFICFWEINPLFTLLILLTTLP